MNVVFLVLAAIVATPAAIMVHNLREVRDWHRASGVVVSTGLKRMRHRGSPARSYSPVVRYRYSVNGIEYHSEVLSNGMTSGGSKPWAQRVNDRYPPGSSVTVWHHPKAHDRACLEAGFGVFGWILVVLAAALLLLAVAT